MGNGRRDRERCRSSPSTAIGSRELSLTFLGARYFTVGPLSRNCKLPQTAQPLG